MNTNTPASKRKNLTHNTSSLFRGLKKQNRDTSSSNSQNSGLNRSLPISESSQTYSSLKLSLEIDEFDMFNAGAMKGLEVFNSTENNVEEDQDVSMTDPENDRILEELTANSNTGSASNDCIMKGIAALLKGQKSTDARIVKLDKKITEAGNKANVNERNIKTIHENCIYNNNLILKNIENVNYLKQEKIDDEIFVSGFAEIPDLKYTIKELFKFYDMPQNTIKSYKSFPVTKNSVITTFLNIKFCTKEDQIKFLVKFRAKPINRDVLLEQKTAADAAKKIRISRRLTFENRQVLGKVVKLLEEKKIHAIRYRNCCYQTQLVNEGNFISIPSCEHLKMLKINE